MLTLPKIKDQGQVSPASRSCSSYRGYANREFDKSCVSIMGYFIKRRKRNVRNLSHWLRWHRRFRANRTTIAFLPYFVFYQHIHDQGDKEHCWKYTITNIQNVICKFDMKIQKKWVFQNRTTSYVVLNKRQKKRTICTVI